MIKSTTMTTKIPSFATRRTACTHLTMDRLYGDYPCSVCHQPSQLGWLYICTQDDPRSPTFDTVNEGVQRYNRTNDHQINPLSTSKKPAFPLLPLTNPVEDISNLQMPTDKLSPWVEGAITRDQYSSDQIHTLQAQRQNVVDVANAAIEQYERESMSRGMTPHHVASASKTKTYNAAAITDMDLHPPPKLNMFPYCKFRACQACRPTFRERSWGKYEDAYATDVSAIVASESCNFYSMRPMVSGEVLRSIGLKAQRAPKPPPHRPRILRRGFVSDGNVRLSPLDRNSKIKSPPPDTKIAQIAKDGVPESRDVVDADLEAGLDPGDFQESTVRAFKDVVIRKQSSRTVKNRKTELELNTRINAASRKRRSDSLLNDARNVPLPKSESVGGLVAEFGDAGKVQVVEGVAVTEESVDLGTANIITSV